MDNGRRVPLTRNALSALGILIAVIALANFIFLFLADIASEHENPYLGILAYIVGPAILIFGIALFIAGIVRERNRRRRMAPDQIALFPRIDLNDRHTRRVAGLSIVGIAVFLAISIVGTYQAYHYTDSDQFCGTVCHQVMNPEYTAYKASPHARVGCVNCHIGSGATWYVKSKLSGAYQVYATLTNNYPRPIPTPVHNLRPAQETCEQCHWPEKFWGAQLKVFNHFGYDEANTPRETRLLIKTGGGSPASGATTGIHWHMNIANEVTYVATDTQRQQIAWVRLRDRRSGKTTDYFLEGENKMTPQQVAAAPKRVMDCVDCHNRPTHIYQPPDKAVDQALLAGRIDRTLPYIKQQAVTTLTKDYESTTQALQTIQKDIDSYYQSSYPDLYKTRKGSIENSVKSLQAIFQTVRFPEMKVDWRTHPNNVGHFYSAGCFRCHDDQHASADGKRISKDCEICHNILGQKEAGLIMVEAPKADFQHPVDLGDMRAVNCSDCHTGSSM
jgi:nitrate/TMAO reductase-like tetraheme cytochrome c subunit